MGDVVGLVEKAAETVDEEEAERLAKRMMQGQFDLNDLLSQLRQLQKMGDMKGLLGMLPGMGKMAKKLQQADVDPKLIRRQEAILLSMTPKERTHPAVIKASRKKRHCRRVRRVGARRQPPAQAVSADGDGDETDEEKRPGRSVVGRRYARGRTSGRTTRWRLATRRTLSGALEEHTTPYGGRDLNPALRFADAKCNPALRFADAKCKVNHKETD